MLADISGYSALAALLAERGAAGAEILSQHLNASFATMLAEVHARGGEVERFAGDALLATFRPATQSLDSRGNLGHLEEAVVRARDCAQAITSRLDGRRADEVALGVHAGVAAGVLHTRHAHLGAGQRAFVLAGDALVQAATAANAAPRGQVRLAPSALALLPAGVPGVAAAALPAPAPAKLAAVQVPAALLLPYISPVLRERLGLAAQASWLAELRHVTAVFVLHDVPQPDAAVLARAARVLGQAVARFEGQLHELGVDDKGLVAVLLFGLHQTHEDQAQRALRAATAIHQALADADLPARLGVATGRVYCGVVGDAQRSELAVVGDAMNLAARLMQAAGHGVLCDAATADEASARRVFHFTPVPGLKLKGMPPDLLPQRPRLRAAHQHTADPSVTLAPLGREAEWAAVQAVLGGLAALQATAPASAAQPAPGPAPALLLMGEAGIGKTTLLNAVVAEAGRLGAALLQVQGLALEQVSPYHAWRGAAAQLLGVDLSADRITQVARLQMALAGDAEAAALAPLLAAVLPHAPAATPLIVAMDAQTRSERLRELLLLLLARTAAAMPLVLQVEDAHWLDSASWGLLQAVAMRRLPVAVVLATRPLEGQGQATLAHWLEATGAHSLPLGPLPREAAAELVRRKLGVAALTEGVEAMVHARAAGHPFFAEELAMSLREAGAFRVEGGLCSLANSDRDAGESLVPDTLARALIARIDGTGEAPRLALKVAAVLGREFTLEGLQAVYPVALQSHELQQHLQSLVGQELLQCPRPGHYVFRHAITRDVAYGLLPYALRRDLHHSWAQQLAQHGAGTPSTLSAAPSAALLAHHWSHAEVAEQALQASETAGMQALERFANREAVHFLREALRWNEALGRPSAPQRVARWLSSLGLAHRLLGELPASRQALEQALRELHAPVPARTLAARSRVVWALLQSGWRRPRVAPADAQPNAANTAVEAYAQLAMLAYYATDVEAITACTVLAGRVAQTAAPSREVAALHVSLAHIAAFFRMPSAMQRLMESTHLVAQRVPTPLVIGTAHQYTGHLAACQGDFARYEADMLRAQQAYAVLGRCRQLDEADTNLACLFTHLGKMDAAWDISVVLEASGRARDDLQAAGWGMVGQARARMAQGQWAVVLERLAACEPLVSDDLTKIEVAGTRALALLRAGQATAALAQALQAVERVERAQSTSYFSLLPYTYTMEALVQLAGDAALPNAAAKAQAAVPRMLKAFRRYAGLLPMARVQLAVWQGAAANLQAGPGKAPEAERRWRRAWQWAAASQVPLDKPSASRWLARAVAGPEQRALLQQAAAGYGALGRRHEAEEADQALQALDAASTAPAAPPSASAAHQQAA